MTTMNDGVVRTAAPCIRAVSETLRHDVESIPAAALVLVTYEQGVRECVGAGGAINVEPSGLRAITIVYRHSGPATPDDLLLVKRKSVLRKQR